MIFVQKTTLTPCAGTLLPTCSHGCSLKYRHYPPKSAFVQKLPYLLFIEQKFKHNLTMKATATATFFLLFTAASIALREYSPPTERQMNYVRQHGTGQGDMLTPRPFDGNDRGLRCLPFMTLKHGSAASYELVTYWLEKMVVQKQGSTITGSCHYTIPRCHCHQYTLTSQISNPFEYGRQFVPQGTGKIVQPFFRSTRTFEELFGYDWGAEYKGWFPTDQSNTYQCFVGFDNGDVESGQFSGCGAMFIEQSENDGRIDNRKSSGKNVLFRRQTLKAGSLRGTYTQTSNTGEACSLAAKSSTRPATFVNSRTSSWQPRNVAWRLHNVAPQRVATWQPRQGSLRSPHRIQLRDTRSV